MSREILFRGKRSDNGQCVEGSLSMVDSRSQKIGKKYGQMFICQVQTAWQNTKNGKLVGYWIEVDPESVGQFTGLLDKNGNKIFEKDVVYLAGYGNYIVQFPFLDLYQASWENDIGSILGNIHDNPELI